MLPPASVSLVQATPLSLISQAASVKSWKPQLSISLSPPATTDCRAGGRLEVVTGLGLLVVENNLLLLVRALVVAGVLLVA